MGLSHLNQLVCKYLVGQVRHLLCSRTRLKWIKKIIPKVSSQKYCVEKLYIDRFALLKAGIY